jgi:putative SOS response-associated peptidase YedK
MPAILYGEAEIAAWLGETQASDDELVALLRPTPGSALDRWRVREAANEARNKRPEVTWRIATG